MALQPQGFDPRQEMRKQDFELQYKRDSYLKDVELHHHDFFEIYFLMSGDVTYIIESRIYHVMPGDILMISPKELHQLCIRPEMSSYERYVLWVDPQMLRRLSTEDTDLARCFDPTRPGYGNLLRLSPDMRTNVQSLMEALRRESQSGSFGSGLLRESLLVQLLVTINRLVSQDHRQLEEAPASNRAVSKVIDYVNLHYGEPLSLDMLAERFYVSKYHLSHEFNRQVGTSIYRYIQKKRLMIARQLLAQGSKPSEVYSSCGFGDYAGFYRAFKTEYNVGPREYALSVRQWNQERRDDYENH